MKDMNEKTIIIPEQLVLLAAKKAMGEKEVQKTNTMIKDGSLGFEISGEGGYGVSDYNEKCRVEREQKSLESAKEILSQYELCSEYSEDSVQIGTKFQALITYSATEEEVGEFFLIAKRVVNESGEHFISCESPLGLAIKGAKLGDPQIAFKLASGQMAMAKLLRIFTKEEKELGLSKNK